MMLYVTFMSSIYIFRSAYVHYYTIQDADRNALPCVMYNADFITKLEAAFESFVTVRGDKIKFVEVNAVYREARAAFSFFIYVPIIDTHISEVSESLEETWKTVLELDSAVSIEIIDQREYATELSIIG